MWVDASPSASFEPSPPHPILLPHLSRGSKCGTTLSPGRGQDCELRGSTVGRSTALPWQLLQHREKQRGEVAGASPSPGAPTPHNTHYVPCATMVWVPLTQTLPPQQDLLVQGRSLALGARETGEDVAVVAGPGGWGRGWCEANVCRPEPKGSEGHMNWEPDWHTRAQKGSFHTALGHAASPARCHHFSQAHLAGCPRS